MDHMEFMRAVSCRRGTKGPQDHGLAVRRTIVANFYRSWYAYAYRYRYLRACDRMTDIMEISTLLIVTKKQQGRVLAAY